MKVCPNCKEKWDDSFSFCPKDGGALTPLSTDPLIGKWINEEYQIIAKIADGGMGAIYQAVHVEWGAVVLKVLQAERMEDLDFSTRFKREGKYTGVINHPNVVKIYELNKLPDGRLFIAMELLKGADLGKILEREGVLSPARAINIAQQAAGALAEAHRRGIIHRDIKPSNIMVEKKTASPEKVTLLDFGIAKKMSVSEGSIELTKVGMILGTFEYSSPEQLGLLKRDEKIDGRADIYSLGIVLYEMITGRVPFPYDGGIMGIFEAHKTEKPKRPSLVRPDLDIPPKLETLILKALEKEREKRQQSMDELFAELSEAEKELQNPDYYGRPDRKTDAREPADLRRPPLNEPPVVAPPYESKPESAKPRSNPDETVASSLPKEKYEPEKPKEARVAQTNPALEETLVAPPKNVRRGLERAPGERPDPNAEDTIIMDRPPESAGPVRAREARGKAPDVSNGSPAESDGVRPKVPLNRTKLLIFAAAGLVVVLVAVVLAFMMKRWPGTIRIYTDQPHVSVALSGDDLRGGVTDSSGLLVLTKLRPGSYTIRVYKQGYKDAVQEQRLTARQVAALSFHLPPDVPPPPPPSPPPPSLSIDELLAKAEKAFAEKHYTAPDDDNVLWHCRAVLAQDDKNEKALKLLEDSKQSLLKGAQRALNFPRSAGPKAVAERKAEAKKLLEEVLKIDSTNERALAMLKQIEAPVPESGPSTPSLREKLALALQEHRFFPPASDNAMDLIQQIESLDKKTRLTHERNQVRDAALAQVESLIHEGTLENGKLNTAGHTLVLLQRYFTGDEKVQGTDDRLQKKRNDLKKNHDDALAQQARAPYDRAMEEIRPLLTRANQTYASGSHWASRAQYEEVIKKLQMAAQSYPMFYSNDPNALSMLNEAKSRLDAIKKMFEPRNFPLKHLHGVGSCQGTLTVSLEGLKFDTDVPNDKVDHLFSQITDLKMNNKQLHFQIGKRAYNFESPDGYEKTQEIYGTIVRFKNTKYRAS